MEAWVGPAIVAAFISGFVSLVLLQLNFLQGRRMEQARRDEKVRDFQIAIRAEIRSELRNLVQHDLAAQLEQVNARYESDPAYSVSVPRPVRQSVFEALVRDIHVLPEAVIDPVVLYQRQRNAIDSIVEDMRAPGFPSLSREQQISMYEDYLRRGRLARVRACGRCRDERQPVSIRDEARSARLWAERTVGGAAWTSI